MLGGGQDPIPWVHHEAPAVVQVGVLQVWRLVGSRRGSGPAPAPAPAPPEVRVGAGAGGSGAVAASATVGSGGVGLLDDGPVDNVFNFSACFLNKLECFQPRLTFLSEAGSLPLY